jgi:hypothetical protein
MAAEKPVTFTSLNAMEIHLADQFGHTMARIFAADLYSWGPRICSDGWHADKLGNGTCMLFRCDCLLPEPEREVRKGGRFMEILVRRSVK